MEQPEHEASHGERHHHDHEVTFHIAVNGEAEVWHHHKISYEEKL